MILDNRQVPDIIVSREGINQNNNNNNNNSRHASANNGSPKHGGNGGRNGNHGSPRHVNFDSPKHMNYVGGNVSPRHGSLGSNGNGSPRHVSYGSPRHVSYGSSTRHRNGNELPDSPCHNPVSGYNNNGSPRHVNRNAGYPHGNPASPKHMPHDGNGNGSPRHYHMNINCSNHGSPRHVLRNGSISPRFMQRVYSFDHGHCSPKHSAAVRTGSCDDSSSPSSCQVHQQQRVAINHHHQPKSHNHHQKFLNQNHSQKQHQSNLVHPQLKSPCQAPQQQPEQEQERASRTPSKIPVQVLERSRERTNSLDRASKDDRSTSPRRSQSRKPRGVLVTTPVRRSSEMDLKNTDFRTVIKEYSQLSPKRVNLRNKNQNLFKYGSCRIEVKDKPTNAWQPWKKLAEAKWHSSDSEKWYGADNARLNTHSAKWNTQSKDSSGDQDEWSSGKDMWNIECDKSEEENDQVFLPDEPAYPPDEDIGEDPKRKKDKRCGSVSSSNCTSSNSNSTCSGSSSSRHGRRESWPVLHGNLMVVPSESERGPSPQNRHLKEIVRKDSLGINPKYFPSPTSGSETGSCSPRYGSRCPSPRYVNRCGSPRNTGNRCASPRNGNFISSPRKGSVGSVCSVDSRKSDFDKETEWDSGVESVTSKMVLIKCKDANYLTRIYLDKEGIHALKVVGRVGAGGSAADHVMTEGQSGSASGQLTNQHAAHDDVTRNNGDVTARDNQSDNTASLISQATDIEFEHETADYQWLLDYDLPCARYRESYSREVGSASMCSGRDGSGRVSVLEPSQGQLQDLSYETLARNLDANLAEIDMDDFRSEDIHNILTLPTMCGEFQSAEDGEMFASVSGSMMDRYDLESSVSPHTSSHCDREEEGEDDDDENNEGDRKEVDEVEEEEYSGVSGELSLYQSGPLFSPLKEPPPLANTTFSVDSLDCDSLHDDLILTCQANKDNYTIAFEGSFIHYSEDSDYHEAGESESSGSSHWSAERLEGRCSAPSMTHSDQPYTTWSRVSRRSSRTPEVPSRACQPNQNGSQLEAPKLEGQSQPSSKSNSMPNLMRRSLMRRSLEAAAGCVKVYDLQNSMRSSQSSRTVANETNNFSLVKLFMRQKSLSKEAVSLSSSISQEGACCSSSDNQSNVHDSSDWPMNSQSENDMDGSASPVPPPVLMRQNGVIYHERGFRRRTSSLGAPEITPRTNNTSGNQDFTSQDIAGDTTLTSGNTQQEGLLNNNNNIITAGNLLDNNTVQFSNNMDNVTSFEDSLKETSPCSKPPVTSPIREEPEGMDISMDSRGESKVLLDQSEKETKMHDVLRLRDNKLNAEKNNMTPVKSMAKDVGNKNINKNAFNIRVDERKRSQSPGTPKKGNTRRESTNTSTRRRQDSGNSSSGYISNRGSTEKIRQPSDSEQTPQKPRPKPRVLKQMSDQCLQTSSLKVSAMVNTSFDLDKKEVYIYYPNYALPDLGFLKDKKYNVDARVFLVPQHFVSRPEEIRKAREARARRPFSCGDMEKLRKHGFGHIRDWDSLNFLLPKELKEMLLDETDCMETTKPSFCQSPKPTRRPVSCDYTPQRYANDMKGSSSSLNSTQPSSGFRGSSTMLNDSEMESGGLDQKYLYKYESVSAECEGVDKPPPLPKRSISLPVEERAGPEDLDTPPPRPPLPRGILRKSTSLKDDPKGAGGHNKRYSAIDPGRGNMREDLLKRRSLQEPMEYMAQRAARETIPEVLQTNTEPENDKEITTSPLSPMGCSCVSTQCTGFCGKGLQKKNLLRVSELPDVSSHEELTEEDLLRIRSQVSTLLVTRGNVGPILTDVNNTCDICPKKSVSFAEKQGQNADTVTTGENEGDEEARPMVYDAHDKKTLVLSVRSAVEKLVTHFSAASSQPEKVRLGTSSLTPAVATIALEKLCPAIYALLSDGLHPSLHSLFGKINNSVWRVIEVTSQISPSTKALSDLVLTLNSEECLSEGPIKFNAFIFGLLNIRSLDSWLSYIRTRESLIQKHYHPEAFLYLSNTATKTLYDDLLLALRPLTMLPFNLDLLHEYKALHASLQKMEERLLLHTSSKESPGDRPPSVLDHLLASKETKEFKNAAQQDRVKALMRVLTSPELDENELLNSTSEPGRERSRSPRPRSCYEHVANEESNPTLKKRWSGVQLGSRLLTAIDKLMLEEAGGTSSEDYTDSIDNPKNNRPVYSRQSEHSEDEVPSDLRISDVSSRDGDVSERSASEKDTENEKGSRACANTEEDDEPEGVRFRRLQLKWEQMAGPEKKMKPQSLQQPQPSPPPPPPEKAISPSSGTRSRIPRPVSMTSPQRPFKPFDPSKEKTSPQVKQAPKPIAAIPKELPKPAPRRSLKDKATTPNNTNEEPLNAARPPSVRSRLAPRPSSVNSNNTTVRASSVPGRVPNNGDKGNSSNGRYDGQRRYGGQQRSASHGRRVAPGDMPKLVQTLHHRLATDNGHLSFNRGDILTLVVEVDDRYLLCCHNDRKGLVPRASVIVYEQ
ncbi:uncharacterized protein [Macrobrachium rosenbergii]|uniref:uncharacterized protein isoform X3 n=3 Tax=Macrobrachium rosenbergii TaxID=79674 RepID=UPI0034D52608